MARSFIVITMQRSGSSWLMDLIDRIDGVEGHMELFYPFPRMKPAKAGRNDYPRFIETHPRPGLLRPLRVSSYLRGLYRRPPPVGFKIMYDQLARNPDVLLYAAFRRLAAIHLVRRNLLDVALSLEAARASGVLHDVRGSAGDRHVRVRLDPADLIARLTRMDRRRRAVRTLLRLHPAPTLEVAYEDLREDAGRELRRICEVLGVTPPGGEIESNLVKSIRSGHRESIENFAEVERALSGTRFRNLLDPSSPGIVPPS